jgi:short-subunit dehydrogenase
MRLTKRRKIVVVTGGTAGVGRAVAEEFASHLFDVALVARDDARLNDVAIGIRTRYGVRVFSVACDVANAADLEQAAKSIEANLGGIDVWVNSAMATVFSPVSKLTAEEIHRGTQVTYLGQVNGMLAALGVMRRRDAGTIINIGSALAYRAVPLQSIYCGAKFAIRGFTESLRSELLRERSAIQLTMVHLPAVNTPQFDWSLNRIGFKARPVAPVYQPEVAARAVWFAAKHHRREVWVGWSTVKTILANWLAPSILDRYLSKAGYDGQISDERIPAGYQTNLRSAVPGGFEAHGRFDDESRTSALLFTNRHRAAAISAACIATAIASAWWINRRR